MLISRIVSGTYRFSEVAGEPSFLKMVEGFFNKAARVAKIPEDRIDFLRGAECSLKFNLYYRTGTPTLT